MKKIFTLAAAVLASFSLWAADPDLETYNWGKDDFATVFTNHDGITLSSDASAWKGNFSGTQYVALGGGTDMSASAPTPYFGITAEAPIDSIEVFWAPNGTNQSNVACAVWADAANLLKQDVDALVKTESYTGSKSLEAAIWQKIDLSQAEYKAVMLARQIKKAKIDGTQQSNFGDNQTVNILGIRVWLKATKTIVSTVETLTAVTINDYPLAAADFTKLLSTHTLFLEDSAYVKAPVVKFTKHTVITYDDETTKEKDEVIEKISQQSQASMWGAMVDIAGVAYSVYTVKPLSYTVTYLLDDESVLGTELVAAGGHPAEYAQYETMPLATFNGWYDSDYLEKVDLTQVVVNSDTSFYADFTKAYAQSIDFEGMVINNGKSYDVKSALTANFYDYKTIDALDSLNNEKGAARNEPYLGLKIKKQGGYIACNVLPGTTLRIKFGYVGDKVLAIAGNDTLPLTPTDNKLAELTVPFAIEKLVKLQTTSDKTVVIKQIMIDQPIATWMYPITYAAAENGKVEGWTIAFPDETVELTLTPAAGYLTHSLTYNSKPLYYVNESLTFVMPAEPVSVKAVFVESFPTALDNVDASVKAVKVIQNGQLLIKKGDVLYNAQGAMVR